MFERKVQGRIASGVALPALVLALIGASIATPAEAHHRHHARHAHHQAHVRFHARHGFRHARLHAQGAQGHHGLSADGATAAIVEDGATGRVIWSMNAEAPRHPASITKVMTLYLLFEQLQKGNLTLDSEIPISRHAASQAPSKLNLRPGDSIRVENAIKAIVTKSANDIAVAVAEKLGDGSESRFAELMTRKARELGMSHTVYVNASGLPNNAQITSAGDLAILGRDIQARFPRYYRYFSIRQCEVRGQHLHNHNHLLGSVEGMDGIKTGYTVASGFNLLTSVKRDGHYIVSVVLGGRTRRARDAYMQALIENHIDEGGAPRASPTAKTGPKPLKPQQPRPKLKSSKLTRRRPGRWPKPRLANSAKAPARLKMRRNWRSPRSSPRPDSAPPTPPPRRRGQPRERGHAHSHGVDPAPSRDDSCPRRGGAADALVDRPERGRRLSLDQPFRGFAERARAF